MSAYWLGVTHAWAAFTIISGALVLWIARNAPLCDENERPISENLTRSEP